MTDELDALLEIQTHDLARDRLEERKEKLPAKTELSDLRSRIAEVGIAIDRIREDSDAAIREIERLEADAGKIQAKIDSEEKRMYSGSVVSPKELSAIQEELDMLRRQKAPLEEAELEQMMRRDELTSEREALQRELADLEKEATELEGRISTAEAELDAEIAAETQRREALVPRVPEDLLDTYEGLRSQKRGVGIGVLEGGSCSACREALSAVETDKIRQAVRQGEHLHRCEHCRRLLVAR